MAQVQLQDDPTRYDPSVINSNVGSTTYRADTSPDVSALYKNILGRAPDATELSSDTENLGKYGLGQLESNLRERAASKGGGGGNNGGGGSMGGSLFDDASTKQLEDIAHAQMGEVRSNQDLNNLLAFLRSQFTDLSQHPGYTDADLALLNTQAFEPIEARRTADQQRVIERTAARGMLPSSGLTESMAENVDTEANKQRTAAGRDIGISAVNQRRADLNQAAQIGSLLGLDIPKSQRAEELNLSQILYNLPRNALGDLMMVLNGSSSTNDLFSQALNTSNLSMLNQQQNDARNSALMSQIGSILAGLFK